jgi:hypothetical protein
MPQVTLRFECGREDRVSREVGPLEWVQITYNTIRVLDAGDILAAQDAIGEWWIAPETPAVAKLVEGIESGPWSDIIIG